ncbi:hypothetical protein EON80_04545 [bacterium]|nr:MAG: hypothetical protein EON80_04545 [bacterium]
MALCTLRREDEAVQALQRAGKCTTFNEGTFDDIRQRIAIQEKQGPVDWNEKLFIEWAELWPHLGALRAVTRELTYRGVDEYKAGHKARAWQHWDAALRAARVVRIGQSHGSHASLVGILVAEAINASAQQIIVQEITGLKIKFTHPPDQSRDEWIQQLNQKSLQRTARFQALARRDGQSQLADLMGEEVKAINARRLDPQLNAMGSVFDKAMGWMTRAAAGTIQLGWFGWHALIMTGLGAIGMVCSLLVTRGGREPRVSKGTVWTLSVFFAALWLGVAFWSARAGAGAKPHAMLATLTSGAEEPNNPVSDYFLFGNDWDARFQWFVNLTLAGIWLLYTVGRYRAERQPLQPRRSNDLFWFGAQILAWLFACLITSVLWYAGIEVIFAPDYSDALWIVWICSVFLAFFLTWWRQKLNGENDPRTFRVAFSAALGLLASVLMTRQHSDLSIFLGVLLGITTLVLLLRSMSAPWPGLKIFLVRMLDPLEACGRVMANLALVLTVAYAVGVLALWPTRQRLNHDVDQYIQMGEVEWMRAQK